MRWVALLGFAITILGAPGALVLMVASGSLAVGWILFIALGVGGALLAASGLAGMLVLWTFARWLGARLAK